ncbi:MAG: hypothetical protein LC791_17880 [Acidobacteria bacterium]|nr:hypothetical protein [Acidobacteriota bacterium]
MQEYLVDLNATARPAAGRSRGSSSTRASAAPASLDQHSTR